MVVGRRRALARTAGGASSAGQLRLVYITSQALLLTNYQLKQTSRELEARAGGSCVRVPGVRRTVARRSSACAPPSNSIVSIVIAFGVFTAHQTQQLPKVLLRLMLVRRLVPMPVPLPGLAHALATTYLGNCHHTDGASTAASPRLGGCTSWRWHEARPSSRPATCGSWPSSSSTAPSSASAWSSAASTPRPSTERAAPLSTLASARSIPRPAIGSSPAGGRFHTLPSECALV